MARFDKVEPLGGSFRAPLGFAPVAADVGKIYAVDINGSGQAIKSVDGTKCRGVICLSSQLALGKPVDVMTDGEIVDVTTTNVPGAAAGASVFAHDVGVVDTTPDGVAPLGLRVGFFVQAWRLVVRMSESAVA